MTQPWGEACRLAQVLVRDPSSQLCAAVNGWTHPVTHSAIEMADLIDLFIRANSKKGKSPARYPRPWDKPKATKFGKATKPQAEIRAALAARGHH